MVFKAVSPRVDIQKVERDQLNFWREQRIFERTMSERQGGKPFVFYEGPPTANGKPGSHHVLARAFKDLFPRYKTMRGYYVLRKGGWDTHGLPVEIEVQKELGIHDKRDIEKYGVAEFNQKCRDSVFRYIADWEKLTERIAFWVSLDDAYVTFTNDYIESVWWILKQFWEKDLLFKGLKVVPYCPRCGTPLSSHEVAQGYDEAHDPSVYVRFPVRDKPGVYFLAWTTTPWTLPSNVALAVGANVDYVQVEGPTADGGTEQLILAAALLEKVLPHADQYTVVRRCKGKDLLGWHYHPLYTFTPVQQDYAYVVAGDFVSTEDGTGIVHIAPAYGADDMDAGKAHDLPVLMAVNATGHFVDSADKFRGMWFKDADKDIMRDLKDRGLLLRRETYTHNYPFCWRCHTPLMYFARDTWFIRTTAFRDKLIATNQTINWVPEHVRDGRFGNWLEDVKDWALGRERYWGTPLPVWVDDQTGDMLCVGSVQELSALAGRDLSELDLHRPHVDNVTFPNPKGTGGTMRRVPELIDVWFDSGAMPFAQWGYPHKNAERFEEQFPADYICEAVDQTRGWFYSLHAISTLLVGSASYKNVICLGHILDEKGEKMSKSKGNIVDPWDVLNTQGADAFRWYLFTATSPGESRRFSVNLVSEVVSKFWLTLWNTYSFFVTYANVNDWTPAAAAPPVAERNALDRWVLAELHQLVKEVTDAYEHYDVPGATRPVQAFVEVLSNWYVRLSRRRFWEDAQGTEARGAYATLYECLVTVAKLIAPAMPFLSDALYRNLVGSVDADAVPSVHMAAWPAVSEALIDDTLLANMRLVQRLVSLGRAARDNAVDPHTGKKAPIGLRQPLACAQFVTRKPEEAAVVEHMLDMIQSELNVKSVLVVSEPEYVLNPLPQVLGRKFNKDFPRVQKALREGTRADVQRWGAALRGGANVTLTLDGAAFEITPEECEVRLKAADGFASAEENGYLAAVDTTLTDDLVLEGLAREVVRRVQTLRRDADFHVSDRISVVYAASDRLARAVQQFGEYIKGETLAETLAAGEPADGYHREQYEFDGETLHVGVRRGS